MRERLTSRWIASLTPCGKRIAISDVVVPGLVLRVTRTGAKTFSVWYRSNGRRRRFTIPGRFPAVELAEARDRVRHILARVRSGDDPQGVKVGRTLPRAAVRGTETPEP
jgi:hypothetical protein